MVMLKFCGVPEQLTPFPVKIGVTANCAVIGFKPLFIATNGVIFPDPDAGIPMVAMELVQLYEVPVPEKFTCAVVAPLHKV